jgi:hypothetical protein
MGFAARVAVAVVLLAAAAAAKNASFWTCAGNHCGEKCRNETFPLGACMPNGARSTYVHLSTVPQQFAKIVTFTSNSCSVPLDTRYVACNKVQPTPGGTFSYISGCESATMTSPAVLHEGCDATGQGCTATLAMKALTCINSTTSATMALAFPWLPRSLNVASFSGSTTCSMAQVDTTLACGVGACSGFQSGDSSYYDC